MSNIGVWFISKQNMADIILVTPTQGLFFPVLLRMLLCHAFPHQWQNVEMEQYEVFSTNRYTDPIEHSVINRLLGSPIMTHLPSPTSNKNTGLQAAALQKRQFTRSDKSKVQDTYFLLYDTVQLQLFIRLLLVSYLSYHYLRNKQNFGIIGCLKH